MVVFISMKVKDLMTKNAGFCCENETLGKAVEIMWQKDCGMVPVLADAGKVIGVVTDRDVSVAATTRNQPPSRIAAKDLIFREIVTCKKDDSIKQILKRMRKHQIKRLPVVNKKGALAGVISINDLLQAKKSKRFEKQILKTLKAIGRPSPILLREV